MCIYHLWYTHWHVKLIFQWTSSKEHDHRSLCCIVQAAWTYFFNFACKIKAHLSKTISIFSVAPNGLGVEAEMIFLFSESCTFVLNAHLLSPKSSEFSLWAQTVMESIYISLTLLHTDTHCVSVNLLNKEKSKCFLLALKIQNNLMYNCLKQWRM